MAEDNITDEEKREYFRVDDLIPLIVIPVEISEDKKEEFMRVAKSSTAFSLLDVTSTHVLDADHVSVDFYDENNMSNMLSDIKLKVDYIINQMMLDNNGLLKAEKKMVNVSAAGVRFSTKDPLKEGGIVELKMLLPMYPPVAVFAYAEINRVISNEDGSFEVSVEYINIDDPVKDEIISYTLSHQRNIIRKKRES